MSKQLSRQILVETPLSTPVSSEVPSGRGKGLRGWLYESDDSTERSQPPRLKKKGRGLFVKTIEYARKPSRLKRWMKKEEGASKHHPQLEQ